jgi:hypothetical protein
MWVHSMLTTRAVEGGRFFRVLAGGLAAVLLLVPGFARTEEVPPADLQAVLLKKIFAYDKSMSESPKILVGYSKEYAKAAEELARALAQNGLNTSSAPVAEMIEKAAGSSAVVILAPAVPDPVRAFCTERGVLSVSSIARLAERGEVSVGIGLKADKKLEIVVHLERLKNEKHSFSSALLGLARVIR